MANLHPGPAGPKSLRIAILLNSPGYRFPVYEEIWEAVADSLRHAGATVRLAETVQDVDPAQDDLLLIIGTPNYILGLPADLAALRARFGQALLIVLWHLEWLPDVGAPEPTLWIKMLKKWVDARRNGGQHDNSGAANYMVIRQGVRQGLFDHVFVFTMRKTKFLQKHGVPSEYLAVGHHPIWGAANPDGGTRDIDVLFLGEQDQKRRGRIVQALRVELEKEGVTLNTMSDFDPAGLWGEARNVLLRRTKIYLSIYRHSLDFSGTRFCLGMGNGALVVSEPVADPFPFVPGRHFIEAPVPDLSRVILTYLQDDAAREKVCRQAREFLTRDYTMQASAERIVAQAREAGAGRLPVTGE